MGGLQLDSNLDKIQYFLDKKRRLITNNKGYLVKDEIDLSNDCSIMIAGASWVEGCYENWNDTIAGNIERITSKKVVNIGVGAYSLIQIIRRIEKEITSLNPEIVVIQYSSGYVDRCYKNILQGVLPRPVIFPLMGRYVVYEPVNMGLKLTDYYMKLIAIPGEERLFVHNFYINIFKFLIKIMNRNIRVKIFSLFSHSYRNMLTMKLGRDTKYRKGVLELCMKMLNKVLIKNNTRCLIISDPIIEERELLKNINHDEHFFDDNKYSRIDFIGATNKYSEHNEWLEHCKKIGVEYPKCFKMLLNENDCHPNSVGYKLVAKAIVNGIQSVLKKE